MIFRVFRIAGFELNEIIAKLFFSYSIAEYDQLNQIFESNFADLESFVGRLEHEWHMLTIQDVVWNYAAKNAKWLHVRMF